VSTAFYVNRVLDELHIRDAKDLRLLDFIALRRGVTVRTAPLTGAEARLATYGNEAVITISSAVTDLRRQRFGTAHELGHWEQHRFLAEQFFCRSSDIDNEALRLQLQPDRQREWEANEFAGQLLLPERFLAPLCRDRDPSLELVKDLAKCFEVSLTATALRCVGYCPGPTVVVFSQNACIKWFRGNRAFEDMGVFIDVGGELSSGSLADRFFRGYSVPEAAKRVKASAWFAPDRYRPDTPIWEQSLQMPSYSAVLTLLWVEENIEDEDDF
jgi:Zn-dependent peptidase ImmA (M78 family)